MASLEEREKHFNRLKRNKIAKTLFENKGAFGMKVIDSRKQEYKRKKMRVLEVNENDENF